MIAAISTTRIRVLAPPASSLITAPVSTGTRIPLTCDAIARIDETISDARYGRRKARRRTNTRARLGGVRSGSSAGTAS